MTLIVVPVMVMSVFTLVASPVVPPGLDDATGELGRSDRQEQQPYQ